MDSIVTVLDAATTRDLTTLATLKQELGITSNDKDEMLRRYIKQASNIIENYTNRVWARERVSEYFPPGWDGKATAQGALLLSRFPVVSVTSVTEGTTALTVNTDYLLNSETGMMYRMCEGYRTPFYTSNGVTVVYTAGYALLGDLPYQIEQACLSLIAGRWSARGRDPSVKLVDIPGVIREEYWVGSIGEDGSIPPEVEGLLEKFRAMHV